MSMLVLLVAGSAACGGDDDGMPAADPGAKMEDLSCEANTPELNLGPTGLSAEIAPSAAVSDVVMEEQVAFCGRNHTSQKKGPGVNPALNERTIFLVRT